MESSDIIIVGGGVIGSAAAYYLASSADFTGRITVIERDPSYRTCSTTLSCGSIRHQFSTPENIRMSQYGTTFLREAGELLKVDGDSPDVGFVEQGYLFLATDAGRPTLEQNHRLQTGLGADIALLEPEQLAERMPWLRTDDLAAGSLGIQGEGWFDPYALLMGLRRKARSLGVEYLHDEVTALGRENRRITSVTLASGKRIACGTVINAAGPRASLVAGMAGIELPVHPRKRSVFVFHCREALPACPLVVDPSGMYFRPEGDGFICGISPDAGNDPDTLDSDVDWSLFEETIWPLLAHRVPAFEAIRQQQAWAGHYAYNTVDQNAILGPHPEIDNLLFANGFSGHGLQQSPAVGRALAEWVTQGDSTTLDLERMGFAALLEGRQLRELNVV